MECRLWVAREWIIRCRHVVFVDMSSKQEPDKGTTRAIQPGLLAKGIPPLSVERWEFWKKRFLEIANSRDDLELSYATSLLVAETKRRMNAIQNLYRTQAASGERG